MHWSKLKKSNAKWNSAKLKLMKQLKIKLQEII